MEPESDTATLESEATKEYLAKEAENIKRAEMSSRPPNWYNLQLNDPRIGKEFAVPEFNTEEGMRVRGLLDEKGDATPFGEDYLMLEDRGLLKDGRMTQKGVAFTTPMEDLLPTSKIGTLSTLDYNDPEVLEQLKLWGIRKKAGLNKKPEDEGNAIMNIFKGIGEMGKSIIAITESPITGPTYAQRAVGIAKAVEGVAEMAVTSSKDLDAFIVKNVLNPARKALGTSDEQIEVDNLALEHQTATRDALYEDVTAEKTWDALTSTTQAVEMRAKASEDYTRQFGPVEGAKKMAEMDRGAYNVGGMLGDVPGLAVGAATFSGGKLLSLGKTIKTAKFAKEAAAASTNLGRLGEASTLISKNIDEATASASIFQKQLDDALLVGNKEAADLAKSQLDDVTATIGRSQTRLGLVNDGIKLNESVVQNASTKIDDLNAPSMVGRKITSGATKKVADAADALGNGVAKVNKKIRALERGLGIGRLPYLLHAASAATLGSGYGIYGAASAARLGLLAAEPLLKKAAGFANIVGDEMLQLTNSSPFWRRVAANEEAGRMTQAFGGLMDYTTPITRGVVGAAKGTPQALPAMTLYEAINSQGLDENAMERAGAGAFVFGSFGRAIGSRNNWNQVKNNEFYNFRNKVKEASPEAFQQFEALPYRDVKQFASSIDAAYPGMFDSWSFVEKGNSKFDPVNKQATINYNDRAGIVKAAAAHEALHGIQFKHQSDGAVASLMLGDETRKGLVRDTDGNLNPEFKQFWDEYNSRLDAQGLPKIDINDAAIEYFTDNGAQTLFEDVLGGGLYKASQKTPLRRSIESVFKSTMAATPIVKSLHFKLGGATDNLGRMVDGSGLLAKGMKELPEVKAMIRNMYRESAGLPKQVPKPQIIKDAPSQDPKHYKAGEIIRKANEEAVQGGTPLPDNVLNPDANGNGFGYLTDVAIKRLEESGVIADGDFAGVIAINSAMGTPSSYLLTNKPIEQGRSVQVEGITSNNIVPINWELRNGRLYLVGMDMVQLKLNIAKAAKSSIVKKLGMKYADILNDIDNSALLHAKNQTTDAYFKSKDPKNWEKRKNFINSVQGLLTESQRKINPLFDKRNLNKVSGIYRTFAWDRLGDKIQMTGEVAVPYGQNSYYSLRDNLMPQPPRMNRNGELVKDSAEPKTRLMPEKAEGDKFYSQLDRVISSKIPNRATPEQIMATIDPNSGSGIKAEEIKWSGIEQALPKLAVDGKVSKDALLNYLRDEGQVKFEEVTLGGRPPRMVKDIPVSEWAREAMPEQYAQWEKATDPEDKAFLTNLIRREHQWRAEADAPAKMAGDPKFAQYVLPGGENYREVVLSMPPKGPASTRINSEGGGYDVLDAEGRVIGTYTGRSPEDAMRKARENGPTASRETYTSSHFPDIPNYVAHMRTNERVDASGKQGLFIEEIQSDRHQAGRKQGYKITPERKAELDKIVSDIGGRFDTATPEEKAAFTEAVNEQTRGANGIAHAPFQTTWPLQMFKRALRDAVDGGKDWIGWTDGATQNARFDLSKQVDKIDYSKGRPGKHLIIATKDGVEATRQEVNTNDLPNIVGKDVAQRIIEGGDSGTLSGEGLQVGGSGMKGFYDTMLPKEIGKYVKQWGGKVEQSTIETFKSQSANAVTLPGGTPRKGESTTIWRIDITPEMRKIAETGQSRFMPKDRKKQSGEVRRSTFEGSPKQPKNNKDLANSISLLLSGATSRQMQREDK
jgi:hypothetical protein